MYRFLVGLSQFILLTLVGPAGNAASDVSACYLVKEKIYEYSSKKKMLAISWLQIVRNKNNTYNVSGTLKGANHHICSITSEVGPVTMIYRGGALHYHEKIEWAKKTAMCHFRIRFQNDKIILDDVGEDHNCSKYVFSCGARIALDGYVFPVSSKKRPEGCSALAKKR